jgi:hypothetical protein
MRKGVATAARAYVPRARDIHGGRVVVDAGLEPAPQPSTHEVTTMMRPPETGGRGGSDFQDIDDAEIEPKRGKPEDILSERPTPGTDPAEGAPDSRLPGADQGSGVPGASDDELPERLGERIENGSSSAIAPGGSDLLPNVEPPETTM